MYQALFLLSIAKIAGLVLYGKAHFCFIIARYDWGRMTGEEMRKDFGRLQAKALNIAGRI